MSYDPGRCFWCENMQCDNCNGINEWRNPHASATIGENAALAAAFGVGTSTISRIRRGRAWSKP